MVRYLDHQKRQDEILELVIKSYIEEGRPVSSEYLRERFKLPFSSATLRNIMSELEDLGYLSHLHTSSGRVPTQSGFRYYVDSLMEEEIPDREEVFSLIEKSIDYIEELDDLLEEASIIISKLTHLAGFALLSKTRDRLFFWGTHFILQEPEFEDITTLRNIFTAFEEKMSLFRKFLERKLTQDIKVLIGEEIGLEEVKNCSLVLSSLGPFKDERALLGVLGPIRMNYSFTISRLKALKNYLEDNFLRGEFLK